MVRSRKKKSNLKKSTWREKIRSFSLFSTYNFWKSPIYFCRPAFGGQVGNLLVRHFLIATAHFQAYVHFDIDWPSLYLVNTYSQWKRGRERKWTFIRCLDTYYGRIQVFHIHLFNLPNNPGTEVLHSLFYRWRKRGSKLFQDLTASSSRAEIHSQVCLTAKAMCFPLDHNVSPETFPHLNWYFLSPIISFTFFAKVDSFIKKKNDSKKLVYILFFLN